MNTTHETGHARSAARAPSGDGHGPAQNPLCRDALVLSVATAEAAVEAVREISGGRPATRGLAAALEYVARYRHLGAELIPLYPERTAPGHDPSTYSGPGWQLSLPDPAVSSPLASYHYLRLVPSGSAGMAAVNADLERRLAADGALVGRPAVYRKLDPVLGVRRKLTGLLKLLGLPRFEPDWGIRACKFPQVWDRLETGGSDPGPVAVIDDGRDLGHPELRGRVTDVRPVSGKPSDGPHAGTVAAVIAARRGDAGPLDGCCSATIRLYNAWTSESFDCLSFYRALKEIAADPTVRVVNLSLGSEIDDPVVRDLVKECVARGKALVAAMGDTGNEELFYPAAYPGVIAVGATTRRGLRYCKSNIGKHVLVSAPGEYIYSITGEMGYSRQNSGTSYAVPMVSAAVWLALRQRPCSTLEEIRTLLSRSTDGDGTHSFELGYGRLDMLKLAEELKMLPSCPP